MKGKCFSGNPPNTCTAKIFVIFKEEPRRNRNTGKLQGVIKGGDKLAG
jgi:hypothetical protein